MIDQTEHQNQVKTIQHQTLLVVAPTVAHYQSLLLGVVPNTEILILDPEQDGVVQITGALANCSQLSSLQIVSHASAGSLQLGSTQLSLDNLEAYRPWLGQWGKALLADGGILLYGCNVAAEDKGVAFVEKLSQLTGADIAASTNLTGTAALGGDWELEFTTGKIETPLALSAAARETYAGVLGFGTDGKVITDFGGLEIGYSVVIKPDGKIVVAGESDGNLALFCYNSDGSLDSNFGTGGLVTTDFGSHATGLSLAIEPDGKIVVAGESNDNFALARYNSDGSLDSSFGTGGLVSTDFGDREIGRSVAIKPDGKIVVAGVSGDDFAIASYNNDGSLDSSFGSEGRVITDFGGDETGRSVAIGSDGKIVLVGESGDDFAIACYSSDGSLDSSFGTEGRVTTDFGGDEIGRGVAFQLDGKIVVVGESDGNFAIARYNRDGSLDSSFGTGGQVITDLGRNEIGHSIAFQPDGKIVVVGESSGSFALVRYNTDGTIDPSFGTDGQVKTDLGFFGGGTSVALQPDGKIVVVGNSNGKFILVRYNSDGSLDA